MNSNEKNVSRSSTEFEEKKVIVGHWFAGWSAPERQDFVAYILGLCNVEQINSFGNKVLLDSDFTRILPRSICLRIFSFLDPRSLCAAAQVCQYWNYLTTAEEIWKIKCLSRGWRLPYAPNFAKERAVWKSFYAQCVKELLVMQSQQHPHHLNKSATLSSSSSTQPGSQHSQRLAIERPKPAIGIGQIMHNHALHQSSRPHAAIRIVHPSSKTFAKTFHESDPEPSITSGGVRSTSLMEASKDLETRHHMTEIIYDLSDDDDYPRSERSDGDHSFSDEDEDAVKRAGRDKPNLANRVLQSTEAYLPSLQRRANKFAPSLKEAPKVVVPTEVAEGIIQALEKERIFVVCISSAVTARPLLARALRQSVVLVTYDDSEALLSVIDRISSRLGPNRATLLAFVLPDSDEGLSFTRGALVSSESSFDEHTPGGDELGLCFQRIGKLVKRRDDGGRLIFFAGRFSQTIMGLELASYLEGMFTCQLEISPALSSQHNSAFTSSVERLLFEQAPLRFWSTFRDYLGDLVEGYRGWLQTFYNYFHEEMVERMIGDTFAQAVQWEKIDSLVELCSFMREFMVSYVHAPPEETSVNWVIAFLDFLEGSYILHQNAADEEQRRRVSKWGFLTPGVEAQKLTTPPIPSRSTALVNILSTLLHTEVNYLNSLKLLKTAFVDPLKAEIDKQIARKEKQYVLSPTSFKCYFGDLDSLLELSDFVIKRITFLIQKEDKFQLSPRVTELFEMLSSHLHLFMNHSNNFETNLKSLAASMKENPKLTSFVLSAEYNPLLCYNSWVELFTAPNFRPAEYATLSTRFLSFVTKGHPEYRALKTHVEQINKCALNIKKLVDLVSKRYFLEKVCSTIQGCPVLPLDSVYHSEDHYCEVIATQKKGDFYFDAKGKAVLTLFSNCVVVSDRKESRLVFGRYPFAQHNFRTLVPLDDLKAFEWLEGGDYLPPQIVRLTASKLSWSILLLCRSEEHKLALLNKIAELQNEKT